MVLAGIQRILIDHAQYPPTNDIVACVKPGARHVNNLPGHLPRTLDKAIDVAPCALHVTGPQTGSRHRHGEEGVGHSHKQITVALMKRTI